jgi:hypothetical protein
MNVSCEAVVSPPLRVTADGTFSSSPPPSLLIVAEANGVYDDLTARIGAIVSRMRTGPALNDPKVSIDTPVYFPSLKRPSSHSCEKRF